MGSLRIRSSSVQNWQGHKKGALGPHLNIAKPQRKGPKIEWNEKIIEMRETRIKNEKKEVK